jgi:hypothetical protein
MRAPPTESARETMINIMPRVLGFIETFETLKL